DGSGHFHDAADRAGLVAVGAATRAVSVDLDHDGDMDLLLATPAGVRFFRNNGDGTFTDATAIAGLASNDSVSDVAFGDVDDDGLTDVAAIAVADYDNDGYLDLFVGGTFYRNVHGGRFVKDNRAKSALKALAGLTLHDAMFVDYDNDGRLDLVAAGTPTTGSGVRRLHNDGNGRFTDRTRILPTVGDTRRVAVTDIDRDR